jgi:hypothetical protein
LGRRKKKKREKRNVRISLKKLLSEKKTLIKEEV